MLLEEAKVKEVKFDLGNSEYTLKIGKTCFGDIGIAVYQEGYFMGLLDSLFAEPYEEPLISIARRIKKDASLLDEVYA
ncbi:TPA: hypothetical protein O6L53_002728 [Staphylococcus aureus]|nr:hypothetical protein [Staphylococcus aureus]HDB3143322.1 hypothetical protein [Staphylococcus aureus]HDE8374455.1 hypothetical protein [Staphylococcus aureus]HEA0113305.1 hypothetical protein [Staphylococcus aureus]